MRREFENRVNEAIKNEPTRIVRIHAKLMGIIPLDIAEEYIENKVI